VRFAALNELLPVSGADGRFMQTRALGQLLTPQSPVSVRGQGCEPLRPNGFYAPETIIWHGREHECALTKQEAQFFARAHANDETELQQLMYKGKGAVWNQRYSNVKPKRDAIAKLVSRINNKLADAVPRVPILFSLRRGYDCVGREDLTAAPGGASPETPR
jgi:hypothetical protein